MQRTIIIEVDPQWRERLQAAAAQAGAGAISFAEEFDAVLGAGATAPPDVVVVGPSFPAEAAINLAGYLADARTTATVIVSSTVTPEILRGALRAGVADVASIGDTIEELAAAIGSGVTAAKRNRSAGNGDNGMPDEVRGKIVTVFSTKGGVGKTVLSTNLAAALARMHTDKQVALLDLDLEFGDVAIMLGIKPERTLADVVQVYERLDAEMLDGYMARHDSGLHALLAPVRPEDAETITVARVTQLIDLLSATYDYVVIDTSASFSEAVLTALDKSDEVFVVTMMDVASIKNTRISLQKLKQLGYDSRRIRIVLNRADSKVLLQPSEVEDAIGDKIIAHIPSDRMVPRSVNKGVPVVIDMPRSEVAKSIHALAKIAAAPKAEEASDVSA